MRRVHCYVSGRVQGVTFRASTRRKARNLGVTGWVKNLPDGRVEVVAEGKEGPVEQLVRYVHSGPMLARVDDVEVNDEEYEDAFDGFVVRYS
jgi:acylphosphatase